VDDAGFLRFNGSGCKDFYLLKYDAVWSGESQRTFGNEISSPSLVLKSKQSNKPAFKKGNKLAVALYLRRYNYKNLAKLLLRNYKIATINFKALKLDCET
jgi:hypothetical protein